MTTYTLSEARKHFSELVDAVQTQGQQFHISVNGKTAATVLSEEDYQNLLETLEILQDQSFLKDIAASEKDYKKGAVIALEDL